MNNSSYSKYVFLAYSTNLLLTSSAGLILEILLFTAKQTPAEFHIREFSDIRLEIYITNFSE